MRKHLKIEKQNKKPNPQSSAADISVVLEGNELGYLSEKTSLYKPQWISTFRF